MSLDRRQFICVCARGVACAAGAAAAAGAALAGCASVVARRVALADGRVHLSLLQHPELAEPGGAIKILPDGQDEPLYVLRDDDGQFSVLSPICTHRGCTVELEGARLVCPCHGSTYDRAGRVLQGPAPRPLTRYPADLSGGVLIIDLRDFRGSR